MHKHSACRALIAIALAAMLSACSTAGKLDNLLLTSLTGDRAFVASTYGPFGFTAELREADARELRRMQEAVRQAEHVMLVLRLQAEQQAPGR